MEMERRVLAGRVEVRADGDKTPVIRGYAAVYNNLSDDLGGFRERILPGAFGDALAPGADVRALWQHDPAHVLGRTTNETLRMASDEHGLAIEIDPPPTTWAADALTSLRRGDVSQMSFGFYVPDGGDTFRDEDGVLVRTLLKVELMEVSPVTFPAYPATKVDVRAIAERLRAQSGGAAADDLARILRAQAEARERLLILESK